MPPEIQSRPRGATQSPRNLVIVALICTSALSIFAIGVAVFVFMSTPSTGEKSEVDANGIVAEVSEHFVLPTDEEPTVATVADPEQLRDQPFFANAKAGDIVLIYAKARKALLYDPQLKKLIEVAPLTAEGPVPNPSP